MAWARRTAAWTLAGVALALALVVVAVLWFTRTEAGVERAGQYVVERIRGAVNGELEVEDIRSRGLLRGVTLEGVRITGPDGRLFLRADSARLAYRVLTLLGGDIAFDRLTLYGPEIHIERLPGRDRWNYQDLFPDDPDSEPGDNIIHIQDATIRDGLVVVRMPFDPAQHEGPVDTVRLMLEEVPGGMVRTVRFDHLEGRFPSILWQTPEAEGRVVEIGQMSGHAYVWNTPAMVQELQGTLTLRDSIVTFRAPHVRFPDSELSGLGQIVLGHDARRFDLEMRTERAAFRDFQWLYPRLPDEGGGGLRLRIQSQERGNLLWLAEDARLRTTGSEVAGSFGIVTGDTLYFANVDLRASPLDLELMQRLLPMELPVDGLIIGTVEVEGPVSSLRTRGDVVYRSLADGVPSESAVRWTGTVQAGPPYAVRALEADIRRLDLAQLARLTPDLKLRGVASGRVRLHGSLGAGVEVAGHLALDQPSNRSLVRGQGSLLAANGRSRVDLRFDAEPVWLDLLSQQYPALARLAGEAEGPVRLAGSLDDLRVGADLLTPAGMLMLDGRLDLAGEDRGYVATGRLAGFRLDEILVGIPATSITGNFELAGDLRGLADTRGRFALDLTGGDVEGVQIDGGRVRGELADGLARIDSLTLATSIGQVQARGTFGLVAGRDGRLDVEVEARTLAPLEPVLFNGAGQDDVAVDGPRIAGTVTGTAVLSGSLARWRAEADIDARSLVYENLAAARAMAELTWGSDGLAVDATLDSLRAGDRRFPEVRGTLRYADGSGRLVARARGPHDQRMELAGAFRRLGGAVGLRIEEAAVATTDGLWELPEAVEASVGQDGIVVEGLLLRRAPGGAEVRVAGVLPWRQPDTDTAMDAAMAVDLAGIPIAEVLQLAQSEKEMDGVLSARLRLTGTALSPVLDGVVAARPFRYGEAVLDSVGGAVTYRDRLLTGHLEGWQAERSIVTATAAVPVELALTRREERLLDRPLDVRVHARGMPASFVTFPVGGLQQVEGVVDGTVALVGLGAGPLRTGVTPILEGELTLNGGAVTVEPLNVRFRDVAATARLGDGSRVRLDVRMRTDQGGAVARGTLDLARPSDPVFDLQLSARRLEAARRRDVTAVADAEVHLGGRYTRPVIGGSVGLLAGEMNLDEVMRQRLIVPLDASLFQLFDGATIGYRLDEANPFLANVALEGLTVNAERNFWLRSRELNVEVAGSLDVAFDRQANDIRLTGSMAALRGTYQLQVLERLPARRFEIREGTVEFPGTPGIDPNLNIAATYRVRRAQGDPLDVVALVTGTVQSPRIRLSSDADPPVSETDLASFLLFGRSTLELSQAETDVVASMREGMLGLARPVFLGLASTQLQQAAAYLGLPVDHLALSAPEYGFGDYSQVMSVHGGLGVLQGTQLEAGFYAHRDVFVLGSFTPFARAQGAFGEPEPLFHPRFGARVEWRFRPTWTAELYWEDRFARTPSFTYDQIHDRPAGGLSVFREWGY
jgi:translocation and assembly module TamB